MLAITAEPGWGFSPRCSPVTATTGSLFLVGGFMFFFTPRLWSIKALQVWAESSLWWLERIVGTKMEVRGLEHLPAGACIVAGKHQSAFDTFAILPLLIDPAVLTIPPISSSAS